MKRDTCPIVAATGVLILGKAASALIDVREAVASDVIPQERIVGNEPRKAASSGTFLERHEFLLRRLHSLSGLVPVGAYMVIHLLTNASVLDGPATFQRRVYAIHSLGAVLPLVEWTFIFLPLLCHAVFAILITRGALPNS